MSKARMRIGALAAGLAVVAIAPAGAEGKARITMSGSTSVAPLAIKLARKYVNTYPRRASFRILQGGSDVGVSDVAHGRVTIGNSSRDPKPTDPGGLVFNKIARDGICIITNTGNPIGNFSQDQIQSIFSGNVRNWSDVPGSNISGPIDVTVRTAASGTQDAFQKLFMGSAKVTSTASQKASNGLVQQAVKSDKSGIGYVSMAFTSGVSAAAYKGVACNLRNAKSGQYEGTRNFWMVTRGAPTGAAKKFIGWVQHSSLARAVVSTEWVPV
jgi:phosphate transport system substrate-binding protein